MEIRPILSALLRSKTAPLLVAIQVALSLAILANALYIVNQRLAASARPSGIEDEANVVHILSMPLEKPSHNEAMAQQQRELEALRVVPGVVSAAWTNQMPMSRSGSSTTITHNRTQTQPSAHPAIYFGPEAFVRTLGLKLIEGRDFKPDEVVEVDPDAEDDGGNAVKTIIITQALAKHLFPEADSVVGKTFMLGFGDNGIEVRIVGVVERLQSPQAQTAAHGEHSMIVPIRISQRLWRYAVRTEPGQRDRVMAAAEEAVRKAWPAPGRISGRTVEGDREGRYRNEKAMAWMLIGVSGLLLLVTISGIVGMTMLRVAQRKKQIGVRRALGARWRDILRYFLTENFLITSAGIALGAVLALGLNQLLVSQLELKKLPLSYLAFGAGALWLLGLAAVYGPASRAANTPPATATRSV
ncbi:MAG TPA: FtsX-like permease family protein [Paucimonas sp.]|nr:FtsX-like permease family protein [Paucimonas sp.]